MLTESAIAQSSLPSCAEAGAAIAARIQIKMPNVRPDALLVFASPIHDHTVLLQEISR